MDNLKIIKCALLSDWKTEEDQKNYYSAVLDLKPGEKKALVMKILTTPSGISAVLRGDTQWLDNLLNKN